MLNATYRNLLKLFVDAGHLDCANAVCDVLNKRGKPRPTPPDLVLSALMPHIAPDPDVQSGGNPPRP